MNNLQGRIQPDRLTAPGAVIGNTLVWDGTRFKPGAGGGIYVGATAPPAPVLGMLWYDTVSTC